MPAPANDNFVLATLLVALPVVNPAIFTPERYGNRKVAGTNIGATIEGGDFNSYGKTVWYKFVTPVGGSFFFSTCYSGEELITPQLTQPIRTIVRVYTNPAFLTEDPYIEGGKWFSNFAGWEQGGMVAVSALTAGVTFYIRVDGFLGAEGNFWLTYGPWRNLRLGSCDGCPPEWGGGIECRAYMTLVNSNIDSVTSYGDHPAGRYFVRYCGGAIFWDNDPSDWSVEDMDPGETVPHFQWQHNTTSGRAKAALDPATYPPNAYYQYRNQEEAENAFRCAISEFNHTGGDISMEFYVVEGNTNGAPPPTFGLYKVTPQFRIVSTCAKWVTVGTRASVTVTVENQTRFSYTGVSVELAASGGASNPTNPLTDFAAFETKAITLQFDTTTANVTATYKLVFPWGEQVACPSVFLGPVVTMQNLGRTVSSCSGSRTHIYTYRYRNTGFWQVNNMVLNAVIAVPSPAILANPAAGCAHVSSENISVAGSIGCVGNSVDVPVHFVPQSPTYNGAVTLKLMEGAYQFGSTISIGISIPA